jgi:ADP-ribose pyrophosphatase YjhB (NUDIX family)
MDRKISKEEREFLQNYSLTKYERPSVAADIVVFRMVEKDEENKKKTRPKCLQILLIKRANYPFKNYWTLPGGFCRPDERIEETARRELFEETNVSGVDMKLIGVYSEPGRDPRGWIISNTYMVLVNHLDCELRTDKEAWEAKWFSLDELEGLDIGFDHRTIIREAFLSLKEYASSYSNRIFDLLPPSFTLAELQLVYEEILQCNLTKQNFRRKMMEFVEETDEVETGYSHRNSQKYRRKH